MSKIDECLLKIDSAGPCWICGKPAYYIEINFQAYFCSELHVAIAWNFYKLDSFRTSRAASESDITGFTV